MTRAAWLLFPTAVFALGCPPSPPLDDAGTDASVSVSSVELCQRFSASSCALRVRCYPAFTRLSLDECVSQTQAACLAEYEALRPAFERGTLSVDGEHLANCERRFESSACPPSFPPEFVTAAVQPFADCTLSTGLLRGAAPTGSTCDFPVECTQGTFCVKPGGVCRGTCAALSPLGEPCGIGCATGLRCDGTNCTYLKSVDETCSSSAECEPELVCLGTCRPRRKIGEPCTVDTARLSSCEPGLACDVVPFVAGASGTCIVPRGLFEPCNFHWSCQPGLVCADLNWSGFPNSAPLPGNCREPDTAQSNCPQTPYASYVGDQCAPGLTCAEGLNTCETLPTRGQPCTPSKRNCSGFEVHCKPTGAGDVGVCSGLPSVGERCAVRLDASRVVAIPCASGFCDTETTLQCRPPLRTVGSTCNEDGECITGRCVPQSDMTLRCAPAC